MTLSNIASIGTPTTAANYPLPTRISSQAVQNSATSSATNLSNTSSSASSSVPVTSSDIQSDVSGINSLIQGVAQTIWSRIPGITPGQIAATENIAYNNIQGAEGSIIARAGHLGIEGVSFNFDPIDATASSPENEGSGSQTTGSTGTTAAITTSATVFSPSNLVSPQSLVMGENPASKVGLTSSIGAGAATNSGAGVALDVLAALNEPVPEASASAFRTNQRISIYA